MSALRTFTVRARDGARLDAIAQGPAHLPPIVLLHGFTDSRRAFEPLLDALPATVHAIAFSHRGHGLSDKPEDPSAYGAHAFADDAMAVLDAASHPSATLLGHSMGAWVAMHTVLRHPARVGRLMLIGAFARFAGNPGVGELRAEIEALRDPIDPAFVRGFQETASADNLPSAFFETVVQESLRLPAHVWKSVFAAFLRDDVPADLAAIGAPTSLYWGDQDPFVPGSDQDLLAAAIPGATLTVLQGLGHSPHWDRPELFAKVVSDLHTRARQTA